MDANGCSQFLDFPRWYQYVLEEGTTTCAIDPNFELLGGDTWLVVAALIEILLRIAVFTSFIFVIVGGYRIIVSGGSSDNVSKGQQTITKALIGFVLAIMATSIVSYLATQLSPTGGPSADPTNAIGVITGLAYRIAAGVAVMFVAIGGFHFTTAGGDPQKISRARNSIIYALIGLALVLFAGALIGAVGGRI